MKNRSQYILEENIWVLCDDKFPLYLITGDIPTLIDTGVTALADSFIKALDNPLKEQKLQKILLTHTHWDHNGGLTALSTKDKPTVFSSETGANLLKKPHVISFINRMNKE